MGDHGGRWNQADAVSRHKQLLCHRIADARMEVAHALRSVRVIYLLLCFSWRDDEWRQTINIHSVEEARKFLHNRLEK